MKEPLHQALDNHFDRHRVILWYDEESRQYDHFTAWDKPGVEKIELDGNEFEVKHRILTAPADTAFLVYSSGSKPADEENWLLDLCEQHFVFAANQAAGYIQELKLDPGLEDIVTEHIDFFANKKERRRPLAANLSCLDGQLTPGRLLDAMVSSMVGQKKSERDKFKNLDEMLMILFRELADDTAGETPEELEKFGLADHFFKKLETTYGFEGKTLQSFLTELFIKAFTFEKEGKNEASLIRAYHFIDLWRNSWDEVESFRALSDKFAELLNIKGELKELSLQELQNLDLFKECDRLFLLRLASDMEAERIALSRAAALIERRKESYWYKTDTSGVLRKLYGAVELYLQFASLVEEADLSAASVSDLWKRYTTELYRIDMLYRKFLYAFMEVGQDFLKPLLLRMEKRYTNSFLSRLSDIWHDGEPVPFLSSGKIDRQSDFFRRYVSPLLGEGKVVFVICSDALRFEAGMELADRLARENRVQTEVDACAALLPTYTQLGMAALLPHEKIEVDPATMIARCDTIAAAGLEGRGKVLEGWFKRRMPGKNVKVFDSKSFIDLPMSVQQEEIAGQDCVYLYSSTIDSVGDNAKSEHDLPDAVEKELQRLTALCKRIINLNRTHIIITSDHGFLYQHTALEESAQIQVDKQQGELQRDRRFIAGTDLADDGRFFTLSAEDLHIGTAYQIQVPRGIVRIRKQGAGSRYVHGGVSLQELAIPVIRLRKAREDDVRQVSFSILSGTGVITTNQYTVKIVQEEPVSSKVQPLTLTLRFEAADGTILSNQREIRLDSRDESQENRSFSAAFMFPPLIQHYNNRQIFLALYKDTYGHLVPVRDPLAYRIQISIAPDF